MGGQGVIWEANLRKIWLFTYVTKYCGPKSMYKGYQPTQCVRLDSSRVIWLHLTFDSAHQGVRWSFTRLVLWKYDFFTYISTRVVEIFSYVISHSPSIRLKWLDRNYSLERKRLGTSWESQVISAGKFSIDDSPFDYFTLLGCDPQGPLRYNRHYSTEFFIYFASII